MVKSVNEFARYAKICFRYNVLISGKSCHLPTLWFHTCQYHKLYSTFFTEIMSGLFKIKLLTEKEYEWWRARWCATFEITHIQISFSMSDQHYYPFTITPTLPPSHPPSSILLVTYVLMDEEPSISSAFPQSFLFSFLLFVTLYCT
jgi:hypothetical protein